MFNKTKKAFTLAEVLITMTVIGIIGALTVPTLITKYTYHTYVVGLKKAYSNINSAIKTLILQSGCPADDMTCTDLFFENGYLKSKQLSAEEQIKLTDTLTSQMKVVKRCSYNESGCGPDTINENYAGGSPITNKNSTDNIFYKRPSVLLADGSAYTYMYNQYNYGHTNLGIWVDVNGAQSPNRVGRDIFLFIIAPTTENGIRAGSVLPAGSKGYAKFMVKADKGNRGDWKTGAYPCVKGASGKGVFCTGRVIEENEMKY